MNAKKILIVCFMLLAGFCLSACNRPLSDEDKRKIAIEISGICSEQYDAGNCAIGKVIRSNQLKDWCDPDDSLYDLLEKNKEVQYYYAMILDENTVLVSTDGELQSVKGYIVTDQVYELNQTVAVPDSLCYDGNLIMIDSEKYENGVYSFSAGL